MTQYRTCYCGSTDFIPKKKYSHYQNFDPAVRSIVQCRQCGIITRSPSLFNDSNINEQVPTGLRSLENFVSGQPGQSNPVFEQRLLEAGTGKTSRKVLDIGAGSGIFLDTAAKMGWEAHGVELNTANFQSLINRGFTCFDQELERLKLPGESYTFIHINHVLEHVADPLTLLLEAWRLLEPGGSLVIEVPNEFETLAGRLKMILGKQNNSHTAYFEHEWFYDLASMRQLIQKTAFTCHRLHTLSRVQGWSAQMLLHRAGHWLNQGDVIEAVLKK
jgi:SAM-dependent methyltransferase